MEECESAVQHFFDLARATFDISPELSKGFIRESLEVLREADQDVPQHLKKVFCMKCFSLFVLGQNCKVLIRSHAKHPNLKILEYHCISCHNVQRINVTREKRTDEPVKKEPAPLPATVLTKKNQQKRKLMMNLFC